MSTWDGYNKTSQVASCIKSTKVVNKASLTHTDRQRFLHNKLLARGKIPDSRAACLGRLGLQHYRTTLLQQIWGVPSANTSIGILVFFKFPTVNYSQVINVPQITINCNAVHKQIIMIIIQKKNFYSALERCHLLDFFCLYILHAGKRHAAFSIHVATYTRLNANSHFSCLIQVCLGGLLSWHSAAHTHAHTMANQTELQLT